MRPWLFANLILVQLLWQTSALAKAGEGHLLTPKCGHNFKQLPLVKSKSGGQLDNRHDTLPFSPQAGLAGPEKLAAPVTVRQSPPEELFAAPAGSLYTISDECG